MVFDNTFGVGQADDDVSERRARNAVIKLERLAEREGQDVRRVVLVAPFGVQFLDVVVVRDDDGQFGVS